MISIDNHCNIINNNGGMEGPGRESRWDGGIKITYIVVLVIHIDQSYLLKKCGEYSGPEKYIWNFLFSDEEQHRDATYTDYCQQKNSILFTTFYTPVPTHIFFSQELAASLLEDAI